MKIGFFITARLKSTRLRQKALLDLEGQTVLGHVIDRARRVPGAAEVVVCTSSVAQDRPLTEVCHEHGCDCFHGPPDDVLQRLLAASGAFQCDYLLLMTADNPLFSFEYAQRLIEDVQRDPEVDYLRVNGLPLGMDPYIIRRRAFEVIDAIKTESNTEFWPEYLRDGDLFTHRFIEADADHRRDYRVTLDYPEDLALFRSVYSACYDGRPVSTASALAYLDSHPEVRALNGNVTRSWLDRNRATAIAEHMDRHRSNIKEQLASPGATCATRQARRR